MRCFWMLFWGLFPETLLPGGKVLCGAQSAAVSLLIFSANKIFSEFQPKRLLPVGAYAYDADSDGGPLSECCLRASGESPSVRKRKAAAPGCRARADGLRPAPERRCRKIRPGVSEKRFAAAPGSPERAHPPQARLRPDG